MSALAIAHKKLGGDLSNTRLPVIGDKFLYLHSSGIYVTFTNHFNRQQHTYISTVEEFNNFKGGNMKTVVDAVKEFKGDYNCKDVSGTCNQIIVAMKNFDGYYSVGDIDVGSGNRYDTKGYWRAICTFAEFNNYVEFLASNMGKCEQSYSDYKFNYKFNYNLKPDTTPTYTQEMADNGVLPRVGMEFMWTQWASEELKLVKMLAISGGECWIEIGENSIIVGNITGCKPLTPPKTDKEKAIDDISDEFLKGGTTFRSVLEVAYDKWVTQPLTIEAKS
jgi:hypothetical protein